jgi:hypothetical protein
MTEESRHANWTPNINNVIKMRICAVVNKWRLSLIFFMDFLLAIMQMKTQQQLFSLTKLGK